MHRFTSSNGIELIKKFEGFSSSPYLCPARCWTIGYGHKLETYSAFRISAKEAEDLLKRDLYRAEKSVIRYINVFLTQHQFDALVSFSYNCGAAALQRSTLRQKLNYKQYNDAKYEFLRWIFANGKKNSGLEKRRIAESRVFSGELVY